MIASFIKLLPFLQMLLEAFKPGEGEQVTRAGKILTLVIVALIAFSGFVSYAYVVQYHALISVQSHDQYLDLSYKELKEKADKLGEENAKLYDRLFTCLGQRPPYEGDHAKDEPEKKPEVPVAPTVPETPVHAATPPVKKQQAAQRPVGVQDANEFRQEILRTLNQ
ncbi:hypothetical protein STRATTON_225 [Erwinia phage vB_EamM_Stratton]|uniref:Uncharacterized protein n=2 Tax=Erskinevirus EaH2 TaxID=2169883 RepID=A0A1B2IH95_9CAUD|nr:hypothetical protein G173_gp125 [Erwinia phage phiEaH2]AFQ96670.1 hypothetical protein [Erwinia phage phiEaH2]ANZ50650.1 hypothetical protein STRATTON_225 [Erwinia phage vB_EamM_Stratton]